MKRATVLLAVFGLASTVSIAAGGPTVSGQYVEARTAEVFTGGCIMGSEAETMGKQAVLAWKVDRGSVNGVSLDGLSVVAALAGDVNLGLHEIGGGTATVRSVVYVDERANPVQRMALVSMAHDLTKSIGTIVQVTSAPIEFTAARSDAAPGHGGKATSSSVPLLKSKLPSFVPLPLTPSTNRIIVAPSQPMALTW